MAPFVPVRPKAAEDESAACGATAAPAAPAAPGGPALMAALSETFKERVLNTSLCAVQGVYDNKWNRLQDDSYVEAGPSFDDDFEKVKAMLLGGKPCAVLVRSNGADVRTEDGAAPVAIDDHQCVGVLVKWIPEDTKSRENMTLAGAFHAIKAACPTLHLKEINLDKLDEFTLDLLKQAISEVAKSTKPRTALMKNIHDHAQTRAAAKQEK